MACVEVGGPISNIPIRQQLDKLLDEIDWLGGGIWWIYSSGHGVLEGDEVAHRLSVNGICLNALWAHPRTSFSTTNVMG